MTSPVAVVVIGAGGVGRRICDIVEACNEQTPGSYELLGVIDDFPSAVNLERLQRRNIPFLGTLAEVFEQRRDPQSFNYCIGVGNPSVKADIETKCGNEGWLAVSLIHPSASIGSEVTIEAGAVLCSGVQISTNVTIGKHVHLNPAVVVGHDTDIHAFASLNPACVVSGDVEIQEMVLVGAGAVVLQGLTLGASSTVGAGACVVRSVDSKAVVKGVPAR